MSQRACNAAALFTATVLGRATTTIAFTPPLLLRPLSVFDRSRSANRAAFHTATPQRDKASGGEYETRAGAWPRVLVVSRRQTRKNKWVDFVSEHHISLLQESGACPILVPRTEGTMKMLEAYLLGGVDGLLVMEGNDLGPQYNPYGPGRMPTITMLTTARYFPPLPPQLQTKTDFPKGDVHWLQPSAVTPLPAPDRCFPRC